MEEYFESGKVTEFNYGNKLTECIKGRRDWGCLSGFGDVRLPINKFQKQIIKKIKYPGHVHGRPPRPGLC